MAEIAIVPGNKKLVIMKRITLSGKYEQNNFLANILYFRWLKKQTILEIISLLFVILFLYTGISKFSDYDVFREQLGASPTLGPVAPVMSWGLPVIEIIVAVMVFVQRYRRYGLYASFVLMIIFTGYVGALLLFSDELPCSCGGIIALLSWPQHLVVNVLLIILAFTAIKLQQQV